MLAPAQAFMLAQTVRSAEEIARQHPLRMNEALPGWRRTRGVEDLEEADVLERHYAGDRGAKLIVVARQASLYNFIHDLYFCMTSNEEEVNVLGKRSYPIGEHLLNATLIKDKSEGVPLLSLMWFQNQSISAALDHLPTGYT